ncbi:hypothetical protein PAMA_010949 [Pampus argenteus]
MGGAFIHALPVNFDTFDREAGGAIVAASRRGEGRRGEERGGALVQTNYEAKRRYVNTQTCSSGAENSTFSTAAATVCCEGSSALRPEASPWDLITPCWDSLGAVSGRLGAPSQCSSMVFYKEPELSVSVS